MFKLLDFEVVQRMEKPKLTPYATFFNREFLRKSYTQRKTQINTIYF